MAGRIPTMHFDDDPCYSAVFIKLIKPIESLSYSTFYLGVCFLGTTNSLFGQNLARYNFGHGIFLSQRIT